MSIKYLAREGTVYINRSVSSSTSPVMCYYPTLTDTKVHVHQGLWRISEETHTIVLHEMYPRSTPILWYHPILQDTEVHVHQGVCTIRWYTHKTVLLELGPRSTPILWYHPIFQDTEVYVDQGFCTINTIHIHLPTSNLPRKTVPDHCLNRLSSNIPRPIGKIQIEQASSVEK